MAPQPLSPGLMETFMERFELKKDELLEQKAAFDLLDANGSGKISLKELRDFNSRFDVGFTEKELLEQFREMGADGIGGITITDYLKVYVKGTYGREVHIGLEHIEEAVHDLQRTPRKGSRGAAGVQSPNGSELPPIKELRSSADLLGDLGEIEDGVEMKLSRKGTTGSYIRAARLFLRGDGQDKEPVSRLRISALGEAINYAIAVALKMEEEGLGKMTKVRTAYPDMPNGRGCAQVVVEVERVVP